VLLLQLKLYTCRLIVYYKNKQTFAIWFLRITTMPLLSTTAILHLPRYSLISSYDLIIVLAICKHIKLNKPLLKSKVMRLTALLNS
jgi:hypothetical protein